MAQFVDLYGASEQCCNGAPSHDRCIVIPKPHEIRK